MNNIKYFKYMNTYSFDRFLREYGYHLSDVSGYSCVGQKQYRGNVLKEYAIFFKNGEYEYFKAVYFKDFNEYKQSRLGFNGNKLLEWYQNANIARIQTQR